MVGYVSSPFSVEQESVERALHLTIALGEPSIFFSIKDPLLGLSQYSVSNLGDVTTDIILHKPYNLLNRRVLCTLRIYILSVGPDAYIYSLYCYHYLLAGANYIVRRFL